MGGVNDFPTNEARMSPFGIDPRSYEPIELSRWEEMEEMDEVLEKMELLVEIESWNLYISMTEGLNFSEMEEWGRLRG